MWHRHHAQTPEHVMTTAEVMARLNAVIDRIEGVYDQISDAVPARVNRLTGTQGEKDRR